LKSLAADIDVIYLQKKLISISGQNDTALYYLLVLMHAPPHQVARKRTAWSDLAGNDNTHGTKNSTQRILGGILIEKTLHFCAAYSRLRYRTSEYDGEMVGALAGKSRPRLGLDVEESPPVIGGDIVGGEGPKSRLEAGLGSVGLSCAGTE
jgi:hypothetical protein